MTPDYEKQALGAAVVEGIQANLGLRAQVFALQAEIERLKAAAAKPEAEAARHDVAPPTEAEPVERKIRPVK